jgi:hypothetical protein
MWLAQRYDAYGASVVLGVFDDFEELRLDLYATYPTVTLLKATGREWWYSAADYRFQITEIEPNKLRSDV